MESADEFGFYRLCPPHLLKVCVSLGCPWGVHLMTSSCQAGIRRQLQRNVPVG